MRQVHDAQRTAFRVGFGQISAWTFQLPIQHQGLPLKYGGSENVSRFSPNRVLGRPLFLIPPSPSSLGNKGGDTLILGQHTDFQVMEFHCLRSRWSGESSSDDFRGPRWDSQELQVSGSGCGARPPHARGAEFGVYHPLLVPPAPLFFCFW